VKRRMRKEGRMEEEEKEIIILSVGTFVFAV